VIETFGCGDLACKTTFACNSRREIISRLTKNKFNRSVYSGARARA